MAQERELIFSARKKDFRVDTFCSGGPGGQHQNKTQSGVRITHIPTGIAAECRETRNQGENWKRAWAKLSGLLVARVREQVAAEQVPRSTETVRTYHEPDNRVKDHASGLQQSYREVVVEGNLGPMVEARRKAVRE